MRNESETKDGKGELKTRPIAHPLGYSWVRQSSPLPGTPNTQIEHTCWDPKDRELFLHRLKSGENLMEDRSGTDVQIVSSNVGIAAKD